MRHISFVSILAISAVLSACGGGSSSSGGDGGGATNNAPVVDAGPAQSVTAGVNVQLAATATDADGDTLSYTWSQSSGSAVTLSSITAEDPTFTAPTVTTAENLVFELSVSDGTATTSDSVTINIGVPVTNVTDKGWIINAGEMSETMLDVGGDFVLVNVLSATTDGTTMSVTTNSIPGYMITANAAIMAVYNSLQPAAYSGVNTLTTGDVVVFGEDVGLTQGNCTNSSGGQAGGNGWWPGGGGACAVSEEGAVYDFPVTPTVATTSCSTSLGPVGLFVNGVVMYNWADGFSYNGENVWEHYAIPFRSKGMDVCYGHGGGMTSQYHHHNYNECLRQDIGDEGTGHSPVYGYAGDGYPVHGPYHSSTEIAESCWFKRDYSTAASATGCGAVGERSCLLNDNLDASAGTTPASTGATTSELVRIDYSTDIAAVTGTYFQDFYYEASCTAQGDAYLDEHNGHDHDGLGYHYHATVESITDFTPKFPLLHGPDYRGDAGGSFTCDDDSTMGPPP